MLSVITKSGVAGTLLLPNQPGRPRSPGSCADQADPVASEAATIQGATPAGDLTTLALAAPLARIYDRSTVTVNANAVLGHQRADRAGDPRLRRRDESRPVVHAQAGAAHLPDRPGLLGRAVDPPGVGQQPPLAGGPNLLARGDRRPGLHDQRERRRATPWSSSATGRRASGRPPGRRTSGPSTARASAWRAWSPPGSSASRSTGPRACQGSRTPARRPAAADPATADEIREIAPLPTLTISRVVSLEDYQNYALGFAGIAKALATWTWSGEPAGVFLTIAGANGATLAAGDPIISSLATALRQSGDPYVPLTIVPAGSVAVHVRGLGRRGHHDLRPVRRPRASLAGRVGRVRVRPALPGARGGGQRDHRGRPGRSGRAGGPADRACSAAASPATAGSVLRASGPQPPTATQPALGAELLLLDPATQGQIGSWS